MNGPPVESVAAEVYDVPTDQPEADGTLSWSSTTVVLARVTAGGEEGIGWTYAHAGAKPVIDDKLASVAKGTDAFAVPQVHEEMVRACRNLGRPGLASCAVSAMDIALWDLKARLLGVALSDLWGRARPDIPLYGSGGFTTYDDRTTRTQVEGWLADGMRAVKIKIGESWGHNDGRDLQRVALTRSVAGSDTDVFVDANGGYTRKQAVRVGRRMYEEYGVTWFEEPVSSDDLDGLRGVRDQCGADIAAGEYGYMPGYFARMVSADAVDCLQADVTRCGGYTDWLGVVYLAAAHGLQLSAHCAPNLHVHAAVTSPHVRHMEYFHDHSRIEMLLFDGALSPAGGTLRPGTAPGHGMTLRATDAERFRTA